MPETSSTITGVTARKATGVWKNTTDAVKGQHLDRLCDTRGMVDGTIVAMTHGGTTVLMGAMTGDDGNRNNDCCRNDDRDNGHGDPQDGCHNRRDDIRRAPRCEPSRDPSDNSSAAALGNGSIAMTAITAAVADRHPPPRYHEEEGNSDDVDFIGIRAYS